MTTETKTFSSTGNAKRAAKAAGIPEGNIAIRKEGDGRFTFHDVNELAVSESLPPLFDESLSNEALQATVEGERQELPALFDKSVATEPEAPKGKKPRKAKAEPKAPKAKVGDDPTIKAAIEKVAKVAKEARESKQDRLIALLKRPEGASVTELAAEFGWQLHTVRGAVAGALKRKLGIPVEAEKDAARGGVVYRITASTEKGE